mmetsp:Transcript_11940/g.22874  ORF Transcript_11940/g.22874 Transcript_11940/m.22874 type:complete len:354 (+) Transcript_11940:2-1063(+)
MRYEATISVQMLLTNSLRSQFLQRESFEASKYENSNREESYDQWFMGEFLKSVRKGLTPSEVQGIKDQLTAEINRIAEYYTEESLDEVRTELMLEDVQQVSSDIFTRAEALLQSHRNIPESLVNFLVFNGKLLRVRSGKLQSLNCMINEKVWFNCDNSVIYSVIHKSKVLETICLKKDFAKVSRVKVPEYSHSTRIAVIEGFLYAIHLQHARRYNLTGGYWENLKPPHQTLKRDATLIVKKETRKLYLLKVSCKELLIQELSLEDLKWSINTPQFSSQDQVQVTRWVNLPSTPLILCVSSASQIFVFNPEDPDEVKIVGEQVQVDCKYCFARENRLISIDDIGNIFQDKLPLA